MGRYTLRKPMKVTIFGSTTCANCKSLLAIAKSRKLNPEYINIDTAPVNYHLFRDIVEANFGEDSRATLPLMLVEQDGVEVVTTGLPDSLKALQTYKAVK
jgi:glutaredoxin-related protein